MTHFDFQNTSYPKTYILMPFMLSLFNTTPSTELLLLLVTCLACTHTHIQVTKRADASTSVWQKWRWRSINDTFVDGAFFVQSGTDSDDDNSTLQGNGKFASYMTASAGALSCTTSAVC